MFILIIKKSRQIDGDERSRTHPGHGYPAHSEDYEEVLKFNTEDELLKKIDRLSPSERYEIFEAIPISIKKTVNYTLSKSNQEVLCILLWQMRSILAHRV